MYQPYPTSGEQPPEPQQRPPIPNSVQNAVKLMYAGAALSFIELVVGLATIGSLKTAIEQAGQRAHKHYTASQLHNLEVTSVIFAVIVGVIAIGLWLWMARANQAGHSYARITGTVFFGLNTVFLFLSLAQPHASVGLIFNVLVWLVGLGAVIMLWRKESGPYFSPRTR
jgi:hypothetical protein